MTATIEMLREKIAHIQRELAEVSAALDEMVVQPAALPNPLAGLKFADPKALLPILDKAFAEMGIDVTQPAMGPEEVQQLMLREGVKPEDNVLSRGIIEARGE